MPAKGRGKTQVWLEAFLTHLPEGSTADPCVEWPFGEHTWYPKISIDGRNVQVTHLVLEAAGQPRPSEELYACHSCDNKQCVAPYHLRWDTQQENLLDHYVGHL